MSHFWKNNYQVLRQYNPEAANLLNNTAAAPGLEILESKENLPTAKFTTTDDNGVQKNITLASKFKPWTEAISLAERVDYENCGMVIVTGIGLGYHLIAMRERATHHSIFAYEPDTALLRAVMENTDCRPWLGNPNLVVLTGEIDMGSMVGKLEAKLAMIALGIKLVSLPVARRLSPEQIKEFEDKIPSFTRYARTNIVTTFANSTKTIDNLMQNLGQYAAGPQSDDLENFAQGKPAVCVAAGPSLAKNLHLLETPHVRERVVVICAQTMLKPLLSRGIRPDFVTALDYAAISARFYEGIGDVSDITLFAEPKANAAILDNFPGAVRLVANDTLDTVLGPLKREQASIKAGSTVAHLSVYAAQYMGCDPIMLIGQDLGFTAGLYYVPGTAIHEVWAPELNEFNTVEMMEWRRLVRSRALLNKTRDMFDNEIYTDEQMNTYQRQFERDFREADQTIINATEGGVHIEHAIEMTFSEALQKHIDQPVPPIPNNNRLLDIERLKEVIARVQKLQQDTLSLRQLTVRTGNHLKRMMNSLDDPRKIKKIYSEIEDARRESKQYNEALRIAEDLNQVGAFRRFRSDRKIAMQGELTQAEEQRQRIERDLENMQWTEGACEQMGETYDAALERLRLILNRAEADDV